MAAIGFRAIVGIVALIIFVLLMYAIYRAATAHNSQVKFPPHVPTCPDFFADTASGPTGGSAPACVLPQGLANRDVVLNNMKAANSSLYQDVADGKPLAIPGGSLCKFLKHNGLTWNGISNVHPCMNV